MLSVLPNDEDAARCKVVALIKNDNIDRALQTIQEFSRRIHIDFSFFKVLNVGYIRCMMTCECLSDVFVMICDVYWWPIAFLRRENCLNEALLLQFDHAFKWGFWMFN